MRISFRDLSGLFLLLKAVLRAGKDRSFLHLYVFRHSLTVIFHVKDWPQMVKGGENLLFPCKTAQDVLHGGCLASWQPRS